MTKKNSLVVCVCVVVPERKNRFPGTLETFDNFRFYFFLLFFNIKIQLLTIESLSQKKTADIILLYISFFFGMFVTKFFYWIGNDIFAEIVICHPGKIGISICMCENRNTFFFFWCYISTIRLYLLPFNYTHKHTQNSCENKSISFLFMRKSNWRNVLKKNSYEKKVARKNSFFLPMEKYVNTLCVMIFDKLWLFFNVPKHYQLSSSSSSL